MKFFRTKTKSIHQGLPTTLGERLANKALSIQYRFCCRLNTCAATWSSKTLFKLLVCFCLTGSIISIIIIVTSFHVNSKKGGQALKIAPIAMPLDQRSSEQKWLSKQNSSLSDLARLGNRIDSFRKSSPEMFDSLLNEQPGFLDSLRSLQNIVVTPK